MPDTPTTYAPTSAFSQHAHVGSREAYDALYRRSVEDNEGFWAEQTERIDWSKPFDTVREDVASGVVAEEAKALARGYLLG